MKFYLNMLVLLMVTSFASAQVPGIINYQGRVTSDGTNYNGTGRFKFALIENSKTGASVWSNDGSSTNGSEPILYVGLTVEDGLFMVGLGDTTLSNMTQIPVAAFTNSDVRLRVWFHDGTSGFVQLSPDQRITSTAYAMMAASIPNGSITTEKLADGAIKGGKVDPNSIGSAQIADTLTLQRLNLGSVSWDGSLRLYAKPSGGGGGFVDPSGEWRGFMDADAFGSELDLFLSNGSTGAVLSARAPGGRVRLWDALGNPTALLGTTVGGGDLNLYQISGQPGILLNGDRSTYDNPSSSGGEISVHTRNGQVGLLLDGDHDNAGRIEIRQPNGNTYVDLLGHGAGDGGEVRVKGTSGNITTVEILGAEANNNGGQIVLRQNNNVATVVLDGEYGANGGARLDLRTGDGTSTIGVLAAGGDATLGGGGILRLGDLSGANLVFDNNEITARNNGQQAPLYLNPNQGNVVIGRASELTPSARLLVQSDDGQDSLRVRVGGQTKFYVAGTGQVGINTTNLATGYELSVNGQVICEELVVQNSSEWPDYVFADDYPLMSLDALNASIQENGHLPGVPKAEQVEERGISIGAMQTKMMEKIEELTLYVLAQHKRLESQEKMIAELQDRLATAAK